MGFDVVIQLLGGLALFLLAMTMMTDGLKVAAGRGLRHMLAKWTSTPLRGVLSGTLVTSVVQSSSAVTVATIGFVNAGVLTLRQALGVIYGTNVGTTMTGWLVSLVGFGVQIDRMALPILAAGVGLRLMASAPRARALGAALAGFGLFFLGLSILKAAFSGVAEAYGAGLSNLATGHWPAFLLAGFVATVLAQSSSAALAIILSAASSGVLGMEAAAAAVIGANLGTTSTAALAVLRATPAARRLALGHIGFNLVTGAVALLLLPGLLGVVGWLADGLDVDGRPEVVLALFHTVFNVFGVLLMLPWTAHFARLLERLFRRQEAEADRPLHLDRTVAATPDLAVAALRRELLRLHGMVGTLAGDAIAGRDSTRGSRVEDARSLCDAVARFSAGVGVEAMGEETAAELARALRSARYLDECAAQVASVILLRQEASAMDDRGAAVAVDALLDTAALCVSVPASDIAGGTTPAMRNAAFVSFEAAYERAKTALLRAAVSRQLTIDATDALLDALRALRRLVSQFIKADRQLCDHAPTTAEPTALAAPTN